MGKALPLPPPHMSEGWPPWALHPCYLRGGGGGWLSRCAWQIVLEKTVDVEGIGENMGT